MPLPMPNRGMRGGEERREGGSTGEADGFVVAHIV